MRTGIRGSALLVLMAAMVAAVMCGCAATKESTASSRNACERQETVTADSAAMAATEAVRKMQSGVNEIRTRVTEETTGVPEAAATLTVGLGSLHELPEGAGYRATEGRASVELRREGEVLVATGHCDSVARLYRATLETNLRQEATIDSLERAAAWSQERAGRLAHEMATMEAATSMSETRAPGHSRIWWGAAGAAAGLAAGLWLCHHKREN